MSVDDWRSLDVLLPRKFSCGGATVVVAIVGVSGSGKSELVRLVARLLRRTSEDVVAVDSDRYWKTSLYRETMYEAVREQMLQCEYNRNHPDH
jgi:ABC-type glutathione transport system ATPase component